METTPIINILTSDEVWLNEAMELTSRQMTSGESLVDYHKRKLGPQHTTFTSEFRFWVWEDEENDWRVYVSNKKGVCFEVSADLTSDQARVAWSIYREKML